MYTEYEDPLSGEKIGLWFCKECATVFAYEDSTTDRRLEEDGTINLAMTGSSCSVCGGRELRRLHRHEE